MDQKELVTMVRRFFEKNPEGVVCAYLFGSRARGASRAGSDVDIGVLLDRQPKPTLSDLPLDLEAALESLLGLQVQCVVLNNAPADLMHRVLRDGILLVDNDPSRRIEFEVRRRNEFFDLQPILREYRGRSLERSS